MIGAVEIAKLLERTGWNQGELAQRLDVSQGTVSRWARKKQVPEVDAQEKLTGVILSLGYSDLLPHSETHRREGTFPVVGYVGLGEEVHLFADATPSEPLEYIELPYSFSIEGCQALIARGNSQWPRVQNGEVVIFHRSGAAPEEMIGQEAIVKLRNGPVLLKTIQAVRRGKFTLVSHNAPIMEGVALDWAADILSIVPAGKWQKIR